MTSRVAIVGRDAVTALGADVATGWQAFAAGRSALAPWPSAAGWEAGRPRVARIADAEPVAEDDATRRVLGRHGAWLERVVRSAHAQAGFAGLPREGLGLYVAFGMVDPAPADVAGAVTASRGADGAFDLARFYDGGFRAMHPLWPLSMLGNVAAGQLAIALDVRGDNTVLGSDAVAGVRVLLEARRALLAGAARAALVGAASEPVTEASLVRRRLRGAGLGTDVARGEGPGEGAAALALETEDSARARGARVLGWLAGAATASGRSGDALSRALADAELDVEAIDLAVLAGPVSLAPGGIVGLSPRADPTFARLLARGVVSTSAAVGDLLGAGPLVGAAFALELLGGATPPVARLTADADAPPAPRGPPLRRILVLLLDDGGHGAFVLEAPSCAS